MLREDIILLLGLTLVSIAISACVRNLRKINFLWVTNVIFIALVLPKIVLFNSSGFSVFLTQTTAFRESGFMAASLAIFGFMISINATYILVAILPRSLKPIPPAQEAWGIGSPTFIINFIFIPVSLVAMAIYAASAGMSFDTLFIKAEMSTDTGFTAAYFAQKVAQVAKCCVFLYFIKFCEAGGLTRGQTRHFMFVCFITFCVFLLSGQRSGIFLLLVQIMLLYQSENKLKLKFLAVTGVIFLLVNLAILTARFAAGGRSLDIAAALLRRYFFDVEKITGIIEYSSATKSYLFNPWLIFGDTSTHPDIYGNVHRFIGENLFNTGAGVPPSVLGEIILYYGGIAIIPVTVLLTLLIISFEQRLARSVRSDRPFFKAAIIIVVATMYYFLLNSDFIGLVKRSMLEIFLLAFALITQKVAFTFLPRR